MPNMKSIISSHNKFFQIQQHNNLTPAIAEKRKKKKRKKKKNRLSTQRKMPPDKCYLPSHSNHRDNN